MQLDFNQQKIVEATEPKIIVSSAAGGGKTRVLTERIRYLLQHNYSPQKIIAITFTNAAADEIKQRLNFTDNLFIGTIHSLANKYLLSKGIDTSDIIQEEEFDKLFLRIKENLYVVPEVDYLLLDEGQDSTPEQFEFLLDIIKPKEFMIFEDCKQCIYEFSGVDPNYILNLKRNPEIKTYNLDINYRCGKNILNFAKQIMRPLGQDYQDISVSKTSYSGDVIKIQLDFKSIISRIRKYDDYKDWFILTRTNAQLDEVIEKLKKAQIPYDTFKKSDLSNSELQNRLNQNTVKVLTIHTSKGLENKNVVVIGAQFYSDSERRVSYVAATRAKQILVWIQKKKRKK